MRFFVLLLFLIAAAPALDAQKHLEGLWEGVITRGGLHAKTGYRFQLFLQIEGHRLRGRSYVYLDGEKVVEMSLRGSLYEDRSVYFHDIEFIPAEGSSVEPPFFRKYQMIYSRSIWENKLEGYWQEIIDAPLDGKREYGRIYLKKIDGSKA
jgi:hypothetical protein